MNNSKWKTVASFLSFLKRRKKFWLLPIAVFLLGLGIVLVTAQGSVIAPFIYPLF